MPENHVQWPRNNGRTFLGVVAGGRSPKKLEAVDRVDDGFGKKPLAVAALSDIPVLDPRSSRRSRAVELWSLRAE